MNLCLKINNQPLELGSEVCDRTLDGAALRRGGPLFQLVKPLTDGCCIYELDDCEFEGLDDGVHIYPCTHGYLDKDRRWHTRVKIYLNEERLQRIVLKVVEGRTAAINFYDRFTAAATATLGNPDRKTRYRTSWEDNGTRVEARLKPDMVNAEFEIALVG